MGGERPPGMRRRTALRLLAAGGIPFAGGCVRSTRGRRETTPDATETATASMPPAESLTGWETFRGAPAHAGRTPDARGPTASVERAWEASVGTSEALGLSAAGGVAFASSEASGVVALDAGDGRRLAADLSGGRAVSTEAAVADGRLAFATRTGEVVAVDGATGETRWSVRAPRREVAGGDGEDTHPVRSTPAVGGDRAYVGFTQNTAEDAEGALATVRVGGDGASLARDPWPVPTTHPVLASPTRVDGTVYTLDGPDVVAVDAADGAERWRRTVRSGPGLVEWYDGSPAVADGRVVVDADDALVALDATTGERLWRVGVDPVDGGDRVRPVYGAAVADGAVYFGGSDGRFRAVDAATGERLWDAAPDGGVVHWSRPAVGEDLVVAAGLGGRESGGSQFAERSAASVLAFRRDTGERAGRVDGSGLVADPVVVGDRAVVAFGDRVVGLR